VPKFCCQAIPSQQDWSLDQLLSTRSLVDLQHPCVQGPRVSRQALATEMLCVNEIPTIVLQLFTYAVQTEYGGLEFGAVSVVQVEAGVCGFKNVACFLIFSRSFAQSVALPFGAHC
jgi:hypothetical protein